MGGGRILSPSPQRGAYLLDLGITPYGEALELQQSLAAAVSQGAVPDIVVLLEHPPTVTLGRRSGADEVHLPPGIDVEVTDTDRGGRSTYHAPGQLVCYPVLDLTRHGKDVKRYCRDLEEVVLRTLASFALEGARLDGLPGVWVDPHGSPRKIASLGVHVSRWVTTHGIALNVDLDPAPFHEWITACGLEDASFTTMARELGRPLSVSEVRGSLAAAVGDVFGLVLDPLPAEDGAGIWPQPVHEKVSGRYTSGGRRSGTATGVEEVIPA